MYCSTGLVIPANSVSVARQFLRCALHQLAPNGIFAQLFMSEIEGKKVSPLSVAILMSITKVIGIEYGSNTSLAGKRCLMHHFHETHIYIYIYNM